MDDMQNYLKLKELYPVGASVMVEYGSAKGQLGYVLGNSHARIYVDLPDGRELLIPPASLRVVRK